MDFSEKISRDKAFNMNPVVLAFIGDAVYSLFVRQKMAFEKDFKSGKLNELTAKIVRANAQARLLEEVFPTLNEDEALIYKRARNAKKPSHAKNATTADYNKSTGLEAVLGFLYVTGQSERLNFILNFHDYNADLLN